MRETPFKRVIAGLNSSGRSAVIEVSPAKAHEVEPVRDRLDETHWGSDIWVAGHDPQRVFMECARREWQLEPPPAGAVFRSVNFPAHCIVDLHKTNTIDFGVVLSGEVWLVLEEGDVLLAAHDCVVLQGTIHGWQNRTTAPCQMAAVLLSGKTADSKAEE